MKMESLEALAANELYHLNIGLNSRMTHQIIYQDTMMVEKYYKINNICNTIITSSPRLQLYMSTDVFLYCNNVIIPDTRHLTEEDFDYLFNRYLEDHRNFNCIIIFKCNGYIADGFETFIEKYNKFKLSHPYMRMVINSAYKKSIKHHYPELAKRVRFYGLRFPYGVSCRINNIDCDIYIGVDYISIDYRYNDDPCFIGALDKMSMKSKLNFLKDYYEHSKSRRE